MRVSNLPNNLKCFAILNVVKPENNYWLFLFLHKLWDCSAFEGRSKAVANKAIQRFKNKSSTSSITALCSNNKMIATGSEDGYVSVYK